MSDKQNMTAEMLKAWEDYLQNTLNDPKIAELMLMQYTKFQDFLKATNDKNPFTSNASNRTSNDVDDKRDDLTKRLDSLEARLTNIEKLISGIISSQR